MKVDNDKSIQSIAVICVYYGEFPWYYDYFIHSCAFNPTVHFYIVTNINPVLVNVPPNVKYIQLTFEELKNLIRRTTGVQVNFEEPYKLCDFKPAYGLIFSHIIEGYDFWAHSDIDIIYGDIRAFLTASLLEANDYVSMRHDYTTGCFGLYRNTSKVNSLFKKSKSWKKVFSSDKYMGFDEFNFKHHLLTEEHLVFQIETEIECFTHVVKNAVKNSEIRARFDFILIEGVPGKLLFNKGQIFYNNKFEAVLYHLFWLKRVYFPAKRGAIPDRYRISPSRIYNSKKQNVPI